MCVFGGGRVFKDITVKYLCLGRIFLPFLASRTCPLKDVNAWQNSRRLGRPFIESKRNLHKIAKGSLQMEQRSLLQGIRGVPWFPKSDPAGWLQQVQDKNEKLSGPRQ